jgi:hypothetical protein
MTSTKDYTMGDVCLEDKRIQHLISEVQTLCCNTASKFRNMHYQTNMSG